jgi:hypothetical protein
MGDWKGFGKRCRLLFRKNNLIRNYYRSHCLKAVVCFKRQLHITGLVNVHRVATEIMQNNKLGKSNGWVLCFVLKIMLDKNRKLQYLVKFCLGKQYNC